MSLVSAKTINWKKGFINSLPESQLLFLEAPQYACHRASLTVEAALTLPFLACFFVFLLFFFRVLQIQLTVQEALEETGRTLALVSMKETEAEEELSYYIMAKSLLTSKLASDKNVKQYVAGGALGVVLSASEWEGDYIELCGNYAVKFPVNLLGQRYILMFQDTRFRKWTGWHVMNLSEPQSVWVYVAESGEAFHRRQSCPYLSLTIEEVRISSVGGLRNYDGSKYKECAFCKKAETESGMVFITHYGDKYHYALSCKNLKRTVHQVKLSEAGGKRACPKCWK